MRIQDLLFPKKKRQLNDKPDIHKEYSVEEIENFVKMRDEIDLKLRIARLRPEDKLKLDHMIKERRRNGRR